MLLLHSVKSFILLNHHEVNNQPYIPGNQPYIPSNQPYYISSNQPYIPSKSFVFCRCLSGDCEAVQPELELEINDTEFVVQDTQTEDEQSSAELRSNFSLGVIVLFVFVLLEVR